MNSANETQIFLGNESQRATASIELVDIQGLWGGRRILVSGSRKVVVQRVLRGQLEKRFEFELSVDEWNQLLNLFIEQDFLTISPIERPGIPDEARPGISLVNAHSDKRTVSKWAGVKDERFDTVYAALMHFEALTVHLEPTYSGPYNPYASPDRFW